MNRRMGVHQEGKWSSFLNLLKSQIWLIPAIISILFGFLAVLVMWFGPLLDPNANPPWWLFSGDARTARDLLGTILSGLLTMTSLVLSMTFVVLTLAANQLGPRLVAIITDDRQIQAAIGVFVGSITYVLIVLRSINEELGPNAVPHLSVTIASALVLGCLLVLLLYVHKISRSIVADIVVERVSEDLREAITRASVNEDSRDARKHEAPACGEPIWIGIGKSGYIQSVDYDAIVNIARGCDIHVRLSVRPGQFVLKHGVHIWITTGAVLETDTIERIRSQFHIGPERNPTQDLDYSVRQLVESALRALSTSSQDSITVVAVVDKLSQALELLTGDKVLPSPDLVDDDGVPRVRVNTATFEELVEAAFGQIRQAAAGDAFILGRIADAIGRLLISCRRPEALAIVQAQLDKLKSTVEASIETPGDLEACLDRVAAARSAAMRYTCLRAKTEPE